MYYSGTGLPTVDPSGFIASQIVMYDIYYNCLARLVRGPSDPFRGKPCMTHIWIIIYTLYDILWNIMTKECMGRDEGVNRQVQPVIT